MLGLVERHNFLGFAPNGKKGRTKKNWASRERSFRLPAYKKKRGKKTVTEKTTVEKKKNHG